MHTEDDKNLLKLKLFPSHLDRKSNLGLKIMKVT